jgi:hypothetical protein
MVFQLSREEVLEVCNECSSYNRIKDACEADKESPRDLKLVRTCKKWDNHFGNKCLFRG